MAKQKSQPEQGIHELVDDLLGELAKDATGGRTILAGDLGQHTWGLPIPHIAFQYVIGGASVLPAQRLIACSGAQKSMKSTLMKEIGCWYQAAAGLYDDIDNEGKTSDTMFDAMSWWRDAEVAKGRHLLTHTGSIEEWQNHITSIVKHFQKRPIPANGKRIPIFIALDSLTGKGLQMSQDKISSEGHAEARSYDAAAAANAVSQYIQTLDLRGTVITLGMVRHLTEKIGDNAGYGPSQVESGSKRVNYQHSINLRLTKVSAVGHKMASHPGAKMDGPEVQGYSIKIVPEASCIGPTIDHDIEVDVLWQLIPQEDGTRRQVMWYDWGGALGQILYRRKYDDKRKANEFEKGLLDKAIYFVSDGAGKRIKCEELKLEKATLTEFGNAIEANPEIARRVQNYLGIKQYPTFQEAEIEPKPEAE